MPSHFMQQTSVDHWQENAVVRCAVLCCAVLKSVQPVQLDCNTAGKCVARVMQQRCGGSLSV